MLIARDGKKLPRWRRERTVHGDSVEWTKLSTQDKMDHLVRLVKVRLERRKKNVFLRNKVMILKIEKM